MRCRLAAVLVSTVLIGLPIAASAQAGDHVWADTYAALGDSYSSGTGTRDYYDPDCQRSVYAYP